MNTILLTDIVQKLLVKNILNIPNSTVSPTHVSRIEPWTVSEKSLVLQSSLFRYHALDSDAWLNDGIIWLRTNVMEA